MDHQRAATREPRGRGSRLVVTVLLSLGLTAACASESERLVVPTATVPSGTAQTLARIEGWVEGWEVGMAFASLQVAYGPEATDALWDAAVPDGLPERDGLPLEDGLYGGLDDVDLRTHVIALYSAGQSGGCSERLTDVTTTAGERNAPASVHVRVEQDPGERTCDLVYVPYRVVLVLGVDEVPSERSLSLAHGTVDGRPDLAVTLSAYPTH